jgi:transposase-like protein
MKKVVYFCRGLCYNDHVSNKLHNMKTPISDAAEIISMHPNNLLGWPNGRRTGKVPKGKMQELERELATVAEQRDRLAEELKEAQNAIEMMLRDSSCRRIPAYTKENLIIQTGEEH